MCRIRPLDLSCDVTRCITNEPQVSEGSLQVEFECSLISPTASTIHPVENLTEKFVLRSIVLTAVHKSCQLAPRMDDYLFKLDLVFNTHDNDVALMEIKGQR